MASRRPPGSKPPLPKPLEGFGETNEAAMAEYGKRLDGLELALDDDEDDPVEVARRSTGKPDRPNLEPIGEETHKRRRVPTQPPSALQLQLEPNDERPLEPGAQPRQPPPSQQAAPLPPPPTLRPRQSPAPTRRGLFSSDRMTNLLAGAAVGLFVMIYPARQFARAFETREVAPQLAELEGAIDHPLGVEAGFVEKPEAIAARIHEGRRKTRRRYMTIWLLVGLPIGLGIGLIKRD